MSIDRCKGKLTPREIQAQIKQAKRESRLRLERGKTSKLQYNLPEPLEKEIHTNSRAGK